MADAKETLDSIYLEMRWRALSLGADLDRIERSKKGKDVIASDPRLAKLRSALDILFQGDGPTRASKIQMIFSDVTPPVDYKKTSK